LQLLQLIILTIYTDVDRQVLSATCWGKAVGTTVLQPTRRSRCGCWLSSSTLLMALIRVHMCRIGAGLVLNHIKWLYRSATSQQCHLLAKDRGNCNCWYDCRRGLECLAHSFTDFPSRWHWQLTTTPIWIMLCRC